MTRILTRGTAASLCALGALALSGCSHDDAPPAQVTTTTNVTPAPSGTPATSTTTTATNPGGTTSAMSTNNTNAGAGGAAGSNAGVADAVNKAIRTNTQMTGSRITAVVNASGDARLTGTAQNTQQKALAESTARQTAGVNHVINKVEIVATGGTKSPAVPKTKVIVVHDQPAPAVTPAPDTTPAPADTTTPPAAPTDTPGTTGTSPPPSGQ